MDDKSQKELFGLAILKLSFVLKNMQNDPGFRVVYFASLKELNFTDKKVSDYIIKNKDKLEAHIRVTLGE